MGGGGGSLTWQPLAQNLNISFNISNEIEKMGYSGVQVERMIKMRGMLTDDEVNKALRELAVIGEYPTSIVIGGPGNSLMEHGVRDWRGYGPERTVKVSQSSGGKVVERWEVRFHMQEPRKISIVEKIQLVDRVVKLVKGAHELFPESVVVYVTMFPRHVERCCEKEGHMKTSVIVGLDSVRRDVDRDVIEMLHDWDKDVKVVQWWDLLGLDKDKNVNEVRAMKVIEGDGGAPNITCEQKCCCIPMSQGVRDGAICWQRLRDGDGGGGRWEAATDRLGGAKKTGVDNEERAKCALMSEKKICVSAILFGLW